MLKIKDIFKKKQKVYDYNYTVYWKDGTNTVGKVENSNIDPANLFLTGKMTYYSDGKGYYYNLDEIKIIEVTDLVKKVEQ